MSKISDEANLLFLTFQYYSRIPTPRTEYSEEALSRAFRYFPLVGTVVGGLGALTYYLSALLLPHAVSVFLSLIVMTLATGAIHEDGFADSFDGFGGGYDRDRILEIMRDSSSGVFGVVALVLLFGFQFVLLFSLPPTLIPVALIAAETSSRVMPLFYMNHSHYARTGVSKGMHTRNKLSPVSLGIAITIGILSLLLLPWQVALSTVPLYAGISYLLLRYSEKKIGGYTGDILGALIVTCRIALLLLFLVFLPYL